MKNQRKKPQNDKSKVNQVSVARKSAREQYYQNIASLVENKDNLLTKEEQDAISTIEELLTWPAEDGLVLSVKDEASLISLSFEVSSALEAKGSLKEEKVLLPKDAETFQAEVNELKEKYENDEEFQAAVVQLPRNVESTLSEKLILNAEKAEEIITHHKQTEKYLEASEHLLLNIFDRIKKGEPVEDHPLLQLEMAHLVLCTESWSELFHMIQARKFDIIEGYLIAAEEVCDNITFSARKDSKNQVCNRVQDELRDGYLTELRQIAFPDFGDSIESFISTLVSQQLASTYYAARYSDENYTLKEPLFFLCDTALKAYNGEADEATTEYVNKYFDKEFIEQLADKVSSRVNKIKGKDQNNG